LRAGSATGTLVADGDWTYTHAREIEGLVEQAHAPVRELDLSGVTALDTIGAVLLMKLVSAVGASSQPLVGTPPQFAGMLSALSQQPLEVKTPVGQKGTVAVRLAGLGRFVAGLGDDLVAFASTLGRIVTAAGAVARAPRTMRVTSFVHHLDRIGWQAVPIVLLITFLIGGIIAQQGFFHFRKFGAETYVVDMLGILVVREIGVLIVAIMVAGRSGSAITAELGSMKMREEIDALRTMGHDVTTILVLPRILALLIALPMLTLLGILSALYGGLLVAWGYAGMSPEIFIARLQEAISLTHFKVGMIKSPFMALALGIVAVTEGLRVGGSAESLGLRTTASVVESIFLVIVLDGLFAIFFASIGM
jgi:phospholipid/cholesterol/gamma-HCH transport system permease protein